MSEPDLDHNVRPLFIIKHALAKSTDLCDATPAAVCCYAAAREYVGLISQNALPHLYVRANVGANMWIYQGIG